jgi:hypothetical protein
MTKSKHIHAPRKSAVKALRALRKYCADNHLGAAEVAQASGIKYATIWLWLGRTSANYNLTHESEDMINLYLECAQAKQTLAREKQLDLWNDNTEQSTDNTTVIPKDEPVRVEPNTCTHVGCTNYTVLDSNQRCSFHPITTSLTDVHFPSQEELKARYTLVEKEPEDSLLVLPKKDVLAMMSLALNQMMLNGNYSVTAIEFKGDSGRILFTEKK